MGKESQLLEASAAGNYNKVEVCATVSGGREWGPYGTTGRIYLYLLLIIHLTLHGNMHVHVGNVHVYAGSIIHFMIALTTIS